MEKLIQQLSIIIEERDSVSQKEALVRALKEVVLSGLSRSGFLKDCPYLSKMDLYQKDTLYILFLHQGKGFPWAEHLQTVKIELDAAGAAGSVQENEHGFSVLYENVVLEVFIYQKDFGLKTQFDYRQQPIPYEMREITAMSEGVRLEIEKALEALIAPVTEPEFFKKEPKKTKKKEMKKKEEPKIENQWVQPSLFDF